MLGKNPQNYDFAAIEEKWQKYWRDEGTYEPDLNRAKKSFYNLMMFPYPSAEGLHVGNMYAFVGSDIYGRFKRMQGYEVFQPIGLDGFGIHSENYSLKIGAHPMEQAKRSEERFYKQLELIGNGFAWNERLETYDKEYYRWTQWLFVQMWKEGLAYRKKQAVNWCTSCKTVLADEQVIDGKCERCSHEVVKNDLEQWFFRITKYADRLLKNLDDLDWSEKIKIAQRNWIGESEGACITFPLVDIAGQEDGKHSVKVFTTRPDTLFGATFIIISLELAKSWLDVGWQAGSKVEEYIRIALTNHANTNDIEKDYSTGSGREKTGVFAGIYAVNPANQEKIPVWVADYVLAGYGTGAIMAVPAHDERDFGFAKKHDLPIRMVICPHYPVKTCPVLDTAYLGEGHLVESGEFNGMPAEEAKWKITEHAGGERQTQYRLRDWLISRQRYWGPPIPMIFCDACAKAGRGEQKEMPGWYAVPESDLPVELPRIDDFRPTGKDESPLAAHKEFYETTCPGCGGVARRETDVSDTFLDSAWYYLRYLNTEKQDGALDQDRLKRWYPIDMYIGGAEHAVLHLLYVRFVAMALHDWGHLKHEEPFKKFRAHGLLVKEGAKMSKSKGNVVNPDEYIKKFGADVLRTYLMFLAPFEQGGDFRDASILGTTRFLDRAWRLIHRITDPDRKVREASRSDETYKVPDNLRTAVHRTVKKVTEDIEALNYNTAVSAMMIFLNEIEEHEKSIDLPRWSYEALLLLLAPFAPHMADELWKEVHWEGIDCHKASSIHLEPWPEYDEKLTVSDTFTLVIQVNGKLRASVEAPTDIAEEAAVKLALKQEKVQQHIGEKKPKKIIFVPGRLINFVI